MTRRWPETTGSPALTRERELAADHAGIDRTPVFAEPFYIEIQCLLGVDGRLLKRVALRVQAREVRRIYVVAALLLRGEDKLDLALLIHVLRIVPEVRVRQGPPPAGDSDRSHA